NNEVQWILSDCIYSEMSAVVGDLVHVVFQEDNIPGTFEWPGEQTQATENRIQHMSFPVSFFVGMEEPGEVQSFEISQIYPNPAISTTRFGLKLEERSNVSIDVINIMGQVIKKIELGTLNSGNHPVELNVSGMTSGIYYVSVTVDKQKITQKIVVQ
ncbi:MAG: T9SS type A sorting domain-containing protein, partial [Bacteroidota bacterium]|nr:T9SS type A sorting domain-containing protein [Bacteroidota bacterium]